MFISNLKTTLSFRIISFILLFCFTAITADLRAYSQTVSEPSTKSVGQAGDLQINRTSAFSQMIELIKEIKDNIEKGEDIDFSNRTKKFNELSLIIELDLSNFSQSLKKAGYSKKILRRHEDFAKKYKAGIKELKKILNEIIRSSETDLAPSDKKSTKKLLEFIKKNMEDSHELSTNPLSTHTLKSKIDENTLDTQLESFKGKKPSPSSGKESFSTPGVESLGSWERASARDNPRASASTQTPEIQFTQEIIALAQSLGHSPAKIYTYVRDNFSYEPYFGSLKGAQKTLFDKQGNDIDLVSLLIALFRVSDIPCEYVNGVAQVPIEKAMEWVKTNNPGLAALGFTRRGIPAQTIIQGGQITGLLINHTWVNAYVDYTPGRGIKNTPGNTWIELDPSFKSFEFTEARDLAAEIGIDPEALRQQILNNSIITEHYATLIPDSIIQTQLANWQDLIIAYAQANNLLPEDVFARQNIITEDLELLPATLAYPVIARYNQVPEIQDSLRHKIIVSIADQTDTISTVILGFNRFSVSYAPAASEDTMLLREYLETTEPIPGYLIALNPKLMLDTTLLFITSNEYLLGNSHQITFKFLSPSFPEIQTQRMLQAGAYYNIGIDLQTISTGEIDLKQEQLANILSLIETNPDSLHLGNALGEPLDCMGRSYFYGVDLLNNLIASCLDASIVRLPSMAILGYDLKVLTFMGAPAEVTAAKVSMSVDKNTLMPISLNGDENTERQFMITAGLATAAMEHNAFEQNLGGTAASTVRFIRESNSNAIPIYTITIDNLAYCLSQLIGYPHYIKDRIENEVNAGKIVTAPQTTIEYAGWTGTAYIVMDPETGSSNFTLFGHLAGAIRTCDFLTCAKLILYEGNKQGYTELIERVENWLLVAPQVMETISFSQLPGFASINTWFAQTSLLDKTTYIASCIAIDHAITSISGRPNIIAADVSPGIFSPNNDGIKDTLFINALVSRPADYTLSIVSTDTIAIISGTGTSIDTFWTESSTHIPSPLKGEGKGEGEGEAPDGEYNVIFDATDLEFGTQAIPVSIPFTLDNTKPQVVISSPTSNDTISGIIAITGTASDDNFDYYAIAVSQADSFKTIFQGNIPVSAGQLAIWNSVNVENGEHTLKLYAQDRAGNCDSIMITIYTDNESVDIIPPVVSIREPSPGDTLSDTVIVLVQATDSAGILWVKVFCDTFVIARSETTWQSPGEFPLLTYMFDNGTHTLLARAQDINSNIGESEQVQVYFDNFIHSFIASPNPFSPNNDGYKDQTEISAKLKQSTDYCLLITDSIGNRIDSISGTGNFIDHIWNGLDTTGIPYPDASYTSTIYTDQDTAAIQINIFTDIYPIAIITEPEDEAEISGKKNVIGTATAEQFQEYTLKLKPVDGEEWIILKQSTDPVVNGLLGTIDATTLLNDAYILHLSVQDPNYTSTIEYTIYVHSDFKVGNFTITQRDITIPLAGLPVEFTRTYSSQNKKKGDFGYGWTMDYAGDLCLDEHQNVTLTLPDGRREIFFIDVHLTAWMTTSYVKFHSASSVYDSLHWDLLDYLFEEEKLTLHNAQGINFYYEDSEIDSIIDRVGNKLAFTDSGITHSSGKGIKFLRNPEGFISEIITPKNDTFKYVYDNGNLINVINPEAETISYAYETSHNLIDIKDPRGVTPIRNEYDDTGRLIRHIDATGDTIEYVHDPDHRTETVIDRLGKPTIYQYDDQGLVTSITNPKGQIISYTYDDAKNRTSETNGLGQTTTYEYDDHGNMTERIDPLGNTTIYTYNNYGQLLTETNPLEHVTTHEYNNKGNLMISTDPLGNVTTFTYDAQGNMTSQTDPLGNATGYSYDTYGNLTMTISPCLDTTRYAYDIMGNKTMEINAKEDTSLFIYDAMNRMVTSINPLGDTTFYEYDELGNQKAVVDPLGRRTENIYNLRGELVKTIYPDSTFIENIYGANGNRIAMVNQYGDTTKSIYDDVGRLIKTIFTDGSFTETEYDAAGRTEWTRNQLGGITHYYYDETGRQTKVINHYGNTTRYQYDDAGRRIALIDANANTTTSSYSATGQLVKTTYVNGSSVVYTYDQAGRKITERDQAMNTTQFLYDVNGRLIGIIDAKADTTTYEYDRLGNRTAQIDVNGNRTEFEYDALGRMTKMTFPDTPPLSPPNTPPPFPPPQVGRDKGRGAKNSSFESYSYNKVGNMLWKKDCNGDTTYYEYDIMNRLRKKLYPDGDSVVYTYTTTGKRESVLDRNGLIQYTYNNMGRVSRIEYPNGNFIEYDYDPAGNRTDLIIHLPSPILHLHYAYDKLNRLVKVTDSEGQITTYEYDNVGNRKKINYPNNTFTEYTYDNLQRLRSLENKKIGNILLSSYEYELGPTGIRNRIIENDGTSVDTLDYDYDEVYRLLEEQRSGTHAYEIGYEYDAVGNRLKKFFDNDTTIYEYDERDQLLNEVLNNDTTFYDYDLNGNTTQKSSNETTTDYTYDFENRLLQADSSGSLLAKYNYDPDGNKISLITPADTTHFLIDPNQPLPQVLAEHNNAGALLVAYLHGDDLISQSRNGVKNYYHYDGLGSTRLLTDVSASITNRYIYYAFGEILYALTPVPNAYMFTGEQFDPNLGFYYLRARLYNPAIGRFLTTDPFQGSIYDPMSLHKYLYCNANPINHTDPSGRISPYTLTALSLAVAIIGILATIAIPCFIPGRLANRRTKTRNFYLYVYGGGAGGYPPWFIGGGGFMLVIGERFVQNQIADESLYSVLFLGVGRGTVVWGPSFPTKFSTAELKDSADFSGIGFIVSAEIYRGVGGAPLAWIVLPDDTMILNPMIGTGYGYQYSANVVIFWFRKKI
ncbi:hypothetical protein ES705_02723 [subsurface metagenome]